MLLIRSSAVRFGIILRVAVALGDLYDLGFRLLFH